MTESKMTYESEIEVISYINDLLSCWSQVVDLKAQAAASLQVILKTDWFKALRRGCIFTFDAETETLQLLCHQGFSEKHVELCQVICSGQCLCGKSVQSDSITFFDTCDETHSESLRVEKDYMLPHTHYCVPLLHSGEKLGLLNLYLPSGHVPTPEEKHFLHSLSWSLGKLLYEWKRKERNELEMKKMQARWGRRFIFTCVLFFLASAMIIGSLRLIFGI